jgi:Na+/melibiose symporter-like transporter
VPSLFTSYVIPSDISDGGLYALNMLGGFCPVFVHARLTWVDRAGGFGIASVYLVPWSMLPDVIDASEVLSGERNESIYYAFFVFFQKFGTVSRMVCWCCGCVLTCVWVLQGLAIGASTLSLQFAGFISSPCCLEDGTPEVGRSWSLLPATLILRVCQPQPDGVGSTLRTLSGLVTAAISSLALVLALLALAVKHLTTYPFPDFCVVLSSHPCHCRGQQAHPFRAQVGAVCSFASCR